MWVGFFVVRGISGREMGSRGGEGQWYSYVVNST
jgi:hypothetical protein